MQRQREQKEEVIRANAAKDSPARTPGRAIVCLDVPLCSPPPRSAGEEGSLEETCTCASYGGAAETTWREICEARERASAFVCSRRRSCAAVRDTRGPDRRSGGGAGREGGRQGRGVRSVLVGVRAARRGAARGREREGVRGSEREIGKERGAPPSAHGMNVQWHVSNTQHACSCREVVVSLETQERVSLFADFDRTLGAPIPGA
ncbi:hypothetical protein KM043_003466 [Ampulex compressa]|nr:hypothetical protein KM043_003466 [Ampulex compressa]